MRLLVLIASFVPALAIAQGLTTLAPGATGGKVLWSAPFSTSGCYATGSTAGASSAIGIARLSKATWTAGDGTTTECANNEFRVGPLGLIVESARRSYALASASHPKTDEASADLLVAPQYVAWSDTTLSVVAGTATVTGLSCSNVAPGASCAFAATVAGTVAITTAEGTHVQVENGPYQTSRIITAAASVPRLLDLVSTTIPAVPAKWCIALTAQPVGGRAWNATTGYLYSLGTSGAANTIKSYIGTDGKLVVSVVDAAGGTKQYAGSPGLAAGTSHRFVQCYAGGTTTVAIDGAPLALTASGAGTGILASVPTTMWIGAVSTASYLADLHFKDIRIYSARTYKEAK